MTGATMVVFLRGVNVGGHKTFKPSVLAAELSADFEVTNVGAAGTFVVRRAESAASVRSAILARLGFEAAVMVCPADELLALFSSEPFGRAKPQAGQKRFVSVLEKALERPPRLPIERPPGKDWQVRVVRVEGPYVLSRWRRTGERGIYPNEVVEKALGLSATTRGWETIAKLAKVLGS